MPRFILPCPCGNKIAVDSGDAGRTTVCENCRRELGVPEYSILIATATRLTQPGIAPSRFQFTLSGILGVLIVATVSIQTATIAWEVVSYKWVFLMPWIAFSFAGVSAFRSVGERRAFFAGFALSGLLSLRLLLAMYGDGNPKTRADALGHMALESAALYLTWIPAFIGGLVLRWVYSGIRKSTSTASSNERVQQSGRQVVGCS